MALCLVPFELNFFLIFLEYVCALFIQIKHKNKLENDEKLQILVYKSLIKKKMKAVEFRGHHAQGILYCILMNQTNKILSKITKGKQFYRHDNESISMLYCITPISCLAIKSLEIGVPCLLL